MSEQVTKKDLKDLSVALEGKIDKAVEDLSNVVAGFAQQVDERFNRVEKRLDEHDAKFDHLLSTIDTFLARIDSYETEMAARDHQFEKLLVWARKVSEKTGIPLENL